MGLPWYFWLALILFLILLVWKIATRKMIALEPYEYLQFLSFTEWKAGRRIQKEVGEACGGWVDPANFYMSMAYLEDEGLVERQMKDVLLETANGPYPIKCFYYRKKAGGKRINSPENDKQHDLAFA